MKIKPGKPLWDKARERDVSVEIYADTVSITVSERDSWSTLHDTEITLNISEAVAIALALLSLDGGNHASSGKQG